MGRGVIACLHPRWRALKVQLAAERTKLGDCADLKQFYRDLEELKEWISEKLPTACDESYKDPTNIQASPPQAQCPEIPAGGGRWEWG